MNRTIQFPEQDNPPAPPAQTWVAEFHHTYFGWLNYDHEFTSKPAAESWMNCHPSPYRQRVRRVA